MKTPDIPSLLHALKPDGHGNFAFATELHRLANELQRHADKCHAAIKSVTSPAYKGDVVGELVPWPGHFPLELDRTGDYLNDIFVRGVSVSEHLAAGLWEQAEAHLKECFGPEESPATTRLVKRMDAADLRAERAA